MASRPARFVVVVCSAGLPICLGNFVDADGAAALVWLVGVVCQVFVVAEFVLRGKVHLWPPREELANPDELARWEFEDCLVVGSDGKSVILAGGEFLHPSQCEQEIEALKPVAVDTDCRVQVTVLKA